MKFDPSVYVYPSRRTVAYAKNGMVATSTPIAAQAGLDILKKGGNAIDAAIATAMCLPVVEPTSNGIGGDAFALVWSGGKLYGLNASGGAPKALSPALLRAKGHQTVPTFGFEAVTVPGAPSAWAALSERFGKLSLSETARPAIGYASDGYAVPLHTARGWKSAQRAYSRLEGEQFKFWFDTFTKDGETPEPGGIFASQEMASTLFEIASTNAESFYKGALAEKILNFSKKYGGYFSASDLGEYAPEWVEPISSDYRGYGVHEIPPNGHGIAALMALNILSCFELDCTRETARNYHLQIEAMKLAFTDVKRHVADAKYMKHSFNEMLSMDYARERAKLITERAIIPEPGIYDKNGTVYLCAADSEGNMISYIQSNYMGFGSGLVVPGTGIGLHNRGNNFTLEEGHANELLPGKRPYHTIIPGFLTKDGNPVGPFGVMGGFMQPQGHLQVVANTVDFHMNPQDALDASRFQWTGGRQIELESTVAPHIVQSLADRGHDIKLLYNYGSMGRGQIIWRLENGVLCGGTEPRTDGHIAHY